MLSVTYFLKVNQNVDTLNVEMLTTIGSIGTG